MSNAKLFFEEEAVEYGLDEAILINYLRLFIRGNKAKGINEHDGRTWTYNTYAAIADQHRFWSEQKVGRIVRSLENAGVIRKAKLSKSGYDHTSWYAFEDEKKILRLECSSMKDQSFSGEDSTIYTKDKPEVYAEGLPPREDVAAYFESNGMGTDDARVQAIAFDEYYSNPPKSRKEKSLPSAASWKRHASTWLKNAVKYDGVVLLDEEELERKKKGFSLEEIEFRPGCGTYDKTRYYEKDGRYYAR